MRILYLDFLKAFLILLVVIGHLIQISDPAYDHNAGFRFIYAFHMSAFMFVSGFVCYKERLDFRSLPRKLCHLFIPFFSFFTVSCLIKGQIGNFPEQLKLVLMKPDMGLWFFWILGFCILLIFLASWASRFCRNQIWFPISVLIVLLYGIEFLTRTHLGGFQLLCFYFPIFCAGFMTKKHLAYIAPKTKTLVWLPLALFFLLAFFWQRKGDIIIPGLPILTGASAGAYLYRFITGLLGAAACWGIFQTFQIRNEAPRHFWSKVLLRIGQETLVIYAVHGLILSWLWRSPWLVLPLGVKRFVMFAIALSLSLLIAWLIKTNKLTRMLFSGDFSFWSQNRGEHRK